MRTLIIIVAVLALLWSIQVLAKSSSPNARRLLRNLVIAAVVLVLLLLLLSGRLPWLAALFVAMLPLLRKVGTLWQLLPWIKKMNAAGGSQGQRSGPQVSTVSSRYLTMTLDQQSGDIDGVILEGGYRNKKLSQLSEGQLLGLHREIAGDSDSCALLEAYMDRLYPQWRDKTQTRGDSFTNSDMDLAQALEILGLPDNPSKEDVVKAHRRLMQKLHPDQGGSTYLATKVNLAKQCVMQSLGEA